MPLGVQWRTNRPNTGSPHVAASVTSSWASSPLYDSLKVTRWQQPFDPEVLPALEICSAGAVHGFAVAHPSKLVLLSSRVARVS